METDEVEPEGKSYSSREKKIAHSLILFILCMCICGCIDSDLKNITNDLRLKVRDLEKQNKSLTEQLQEKGCVHYY